MDAGRPANTSTRSPTTEETILAKGAFIVTPRNPTERMVLPRFEDVLEARNIYREEGLIPLIAKSIEYITPARRGDTDALQATRRAGFVYMLVRAQTKFDFREDFYPTGAGEVPVHEDMQICDVGCGLGTIAKVFHENHPECDYRGLDINKHQIDKLTREFEDTNYEFGHLDVFNGKYNPGGSISPEDVTLPYPDDFFDLLIMKSVFTHMRPSTVRNYLSEIARILDPGGEAWTTWFLIQGESPPRDALFDFDVAMGDYWTNDRDNPESAIAYPEDGAREMISRSSLEIEHSKPGYWRRPPPSDREIRDNQDVLVLSTAPL